MDRMLESLLGALILVVTGACVYFIGKVHEAVYARLQAKVRKSSRLRPVDAARHRSINDMLTGLLYTLQASRITIHQFHNGEVFSLANHAWKVSCTYEVLDPGSRSTWRENQNVPASMVSDWVGPLLTDDVRVDGVRSCVLAPQTAKRAGGRSIYYEVDAMQSSVGKTMAHEQGVAHVFAVNLVDANRHTTFGAIALQFKALPYEQLRHIEEELGRVYAVADQVQVLLSSDLPFNDTPTRPGFWAWLFRAS